MVFHRSSNQNLEASHHNHTAMRCSVTHARNRTATGQHLGRAFRYDIRGTYAYGHVADACNRQTADQDSWCAGRGNRPADVWNRPGSHRAGVHVGEAGGGLHEGDLQ
jgi:hypothetical protein